MSARHVCLARLDISQRYVHDPADKVLTSPDLKKIIVRFADGNTTYLLQTISNPVLQVDEIIYRYNEPCEDEGDCDIASHFSLLCDSFKKFVESFRRICKGRPYSITVWEGPDCFATKKDISWSDVLRDDAAKAAFKCCRFLHGKRSDRVNVSGGVSFACFAISRGTFVNMTHFKYMNCGIDDCKMAMLSSAMIKGNLSSLLFLMLSQNEIGDEGMRSLAEAIGGGLFVELKELWLNKNNIGNLGIEAFVGSISKGDKINLANLEALYLQENQIGEDGMQSIATLVEEENAARIPNMLFLDLQENKHTTEAVAEAISLHRNVWPHVRLLGEGNGSEEDESEEE